MKTASILATTLALTLCGCLTEDDPTITVDDDQAEADDGTTTIAALGGDIINFTTPMPICDNPRRYYSVMRVSLLSDPQAPLTVTLTSSSPSALTVNPTSLSFDSSNWAGLRAVSLAGPLNGPQTNVTVTGSAPGYNSKSIIVNTRRCSY